MIRWRAQTGSCAEQARRFEVYEPDGVAVTMVEEGVSAEQCWQAIDDTPQASTVLSLRPFCLRTNEGNVIYGESDIFGTLLLLTAWKPEYSS